VIGDENTRARGIEAGRAMNLEPHADQAQNIAEEKALRPIIFSRIDECREENQKDAYHREVNSTDGP